MSGKRPEPAAARIAITFDDGPSEWTEAILDSFARNDAKATFFLIGSHAERRPDLVRRIGAEGHELGNHTWSHPRLTGVAADEELLDELRRTNEVLAALTGAAPRRFRAPYHDLDERVRRLAEGIGLAFTPSTVVPPDWHPATRWAFIATVVLQRAAPGAVVGLHDGFPADEEDAGSSSRLETVRAVEHFLPRLRDAGYDCVTASALLDSPSD